MTGQLILDFILSQCDKNPDDTVYRALALKWLNLILKDIDSRQDGFHYRFLEVKGTAFSLTASDFDYDLATIAPAIDTTKVIHVYEKRNDITYKFVPYERFRELVANEARDLGTTYIYSIFAGNLLLYPVPDFTAVTGVATAIVANKLSAAAATFITDNIREGMQVTNTISGATALVTAVDSEILLTLDTNIFPLGTETYSIKEVSYIDYIKLITAATDGTTALLVPDKYEKVVIDGILEFAYKLDPELGGWQDQHQLYDNGIAQMIRENQQIIAENKVPISHREKHRGETGVNSGLFPLSNTNM